MTLEEENLLREIINNIITEHYHFRRLKCGNGFKSLRGRCVPMTSRERLRRSQAAHKRRRRNKI